MFGSDEELILYKKITKTIKFSKLWNAQLFPFIFRKSASDSNKVWERSP